MEDAERWGIKLSPDHLAPPEEQGVFPEHAFAVEAFLLASSQLRMMTRADGGTRLLGLDYAGVRAGLEALQIDVSPELWSQIMTVEIGAIAEWNKTR